MKSLMLMAVLLLASVFAGCGDDKGTESNGNHPPSIPANPSPANNASEQSLDITLSWQCSDPDGDNLVFDLYWGVGSTPNIVSTNITQTSYNPGQLQQSTTYFWKVIAKDNSGHSTSSPVWNYRTIGNQPPAVPSNPSISTYSFGDVGVKVQLSWECSDSEYDPLSYDIYFGSSPNPQIIESNYTNDLYSVYTGDFLPYNTTYYWKIVAKDDHQNETASQIWQFRTLKKIQLVGRLQPQAIIYKVIVSGSYAYLADLNGKLFAVDISNPASPSTVDVLNLPGITEIAINGNYLFASADNRFVVINVSNPTNLGIVLTSNPTFTTGDCCAWNIFVANDHVFICSRSTLTGPGYVDIFDVTIPSSPSHVGLIPGTGDDSFYDIFVSGSTLYAAWTSGVEIFDVSDPTSPITLTKALDVWRYVFVDNTKAYSASSGRSALRIMDVSTPANPNLLGTYVPQTFDLKIRGLFTEGDYVYIASHNYTLNGLQVIDVKDPMKPVRIGMYRSPDGAEDVFVYEGYIYLAVRDQGLMILQIVQ